MLQQAQNKPPLLILICLPSVFRGPKPSLSPSEHRPRRTHVEPTSNPHREADPNTNSTNKRTAALCRGFQPLCNRQAQKPSGTQSPGGDPSTWSPSLGCTSGALGLAAYCLVTQRQPGSPCCAWASWLEASHRAPSESRMAQLWEKLPPTWGGSALQTRPPGLGAFTTGRLGST